MNQLAQVYSNIALFQPRIRAEKIVFTNGCFDILHAGHIKNLQAARELGDLLIVGLNSDASIKVLKGATRPIHTWIDRAAVLASLRFVDVVIGFDEETPIDLIKELKPSIICKGGDYQKSKMIGGDFVASYGGEIHILPYYKGYSTTKILEVTAKK